MNLVVVGSNPTTVTFLHKRLTWSSKFKLCPTSYHDAFLKWHLLNYVVNIWKSKRNLFQNHFMHRKLFVNCQFGFMLGDSRFS